MLLQLFWIVFFLCLPVDFQDRSGGVLQPSRSSSTHFSISKVVAYVLYLWGPLIEGMWNISLLEGSFMPVLERSLEYKLSEYFTSAG